MHAEFRQEEVLELWFPDSGHQATNESHAAFWQERMQGGMDARICERFADVTLAAVRGGLDHWAENPYGRLALILVLDQFSRSLWRDRPEAFGQDIKATRLALEGIENGHYAALKNAWEKQFYLLAILHCEGPDHLARSEWAVAMNEELVKKDALPHLDRYKELAVPQSKRMRDVIARFGRNSHRNPIIGRVSTPEEEDYIAGGDFPHVQKGPPARDSA